MMSQANNAVQGVRDMAETAAQPVAQKVNERTAVFNKQVGKLVTKFNKGIENMKTSVHDLARGMTDGLKDASEKVAAQLAQSVHEHVRQEIELARAAELARRPSTIPPLWTPCALASFCAASSASSASSCR